MADINLGKKLADNPVDSSKIKNCTAHQEMVHPQVLAGAEVNTFLPRASSPMARMEGGGKRLRRCSRYSKFSESIFFGNLIRGDIHSRHFASLVSYPALQL